MKIQLLTELRLLLTQSFPRHAKYTCCAPHSIFVLGLFLEEMDKFSYLLTYLQTARSTTFPFCLQLVIETKDNIITQCMMMARKKCYGQISCMKNVLNMIQNVISGFSFSFRVKKTWNALYYNCWPFNWYFITQFMFMISWSFLYSSFLVPCVRTAYW